MLSLSAFPPARPRAHQSLPVEGSVSQETVMAGLPPVAIGADLGGGSGWKEEHSSTPFSRQRRNETTQGKNDVSKIALPYRNLHTI